MIQRCLGFYNNQVLVVYLWEMLHLLARSELSNEFITLSKGLCELVDALLQLALLLKSSVQLERQLSSYILGFLQLCLQQG